MNTESKITGNRQIANNLIYLFLRLIVSLSVNLYFSRAILEALGVVDYGIYNIVAGFVSMLSLFTISLSSAAVRFLTIEIGKGDKMMINDTFSTLQLLLFLLSLIVIFLGETLGLYFFDQYLVIPESRKEIAFFSYQCSIVVFILNLLTVPYQSLVTAYEKFNFYASIEIAQSLFKLIIVLLLYVFPFDRLAVYSVLFILMSFLVRFTYGIYCSYNFRDVHFSFTFKKYVLKQIASYSGWVTIGASSSILKEQGINVLINMFFGVLMNAARGISMQVYALTSSFSNSFYTAIQPQITKSYAVGDLKRSIELTFLLAKFQGFIIILISLPILFEINYILELWLGNVPENTVTFVQWALLLCYARALENTHGPLFLATGRVKNLQIVGGGLMLLNLPISYILLKIGCSVFVTMQVGVVIEFVTMFVSFMFLRNYVDFPIVKFYKEAILPQFFVIGLSLFISVPLQRCCAEDGFLRLFLMSAVLLLLVTSFSYILLLNKNERFLFRMFVIDKLKIKC